MGEIAITRFFKFTFSLWILSSTATLSQMPSPEEVINSIQIVDYAYQTFSDPKTGQPIHLKFSLDFGTYGSTAPLELESLSAQIVQQMDSVVARYHKFEDLSPTDRVKIADGFKSEMKRRFSNVEFKNKFKAEVETKLAADRKNIGYIRNHVRTMMMGGNEAVADSVVVATKWVQEKKLKFVLDAEGYGPSENKYALPVSKPGDMIEVRMGFREGNPGEYTWSNSVKHMMNAMVEVRNIERGITHPRKEGFNEHQALYDRWARTLVTQSSGSYTSAPDPKTRETKPMRIKEDSLESQIEWAYTRIFSEGEDTRMEIDLVQDTLGVPYDISQPQGVNAGRIFHRLRQAVDNGATFREIQKWDAEKRGSVFSRPSQEAAVSDAQKIIKGEPVLSSSAAACGDRTRRLAASP